MSRSEISYKGAEFTSHDDVMAVWLHLMVAEIDKLEPLPLWLKEIREEWNIQSTVNLGYVDPGLNRVISTDEQRKLILTICDAAMQVLLKYGEYIEKDELNAMKVGVGGEGSFFTARLPTKWFIRHGDYFIRLLKNELTSEEDDASIDMYN